MTAHRDRRSVLHYAYRLLSYRDRSEAEMVRRLTMKGFDEPAVAGAILQLKESGFIDDRKLAASLRRYAEESKHLSASGTRRFLLKRGLPAEMISDALGDTDEIGTARRLVEKKISAWGKHAATGRSLHVDAALFRKLYGILYRRGYPSDAIKEVLEPYRDKEDTE